MKWHLPKAETYAVSDPEKAFEISHLDVALLHVPIHARRMAVDAGANVGVWTVAMARLFKHVYAFEPASDVYPCLRQNTAHLPRVECIPVALGAVRGAAYLGDDLARPGNTGARFLQDRGELVRVVTLDSFVLKDLDFLKIDVEGEELNVLRGARHTIARCHPVILMEVKDLGRGDYLAAERQLQEWGYDAVDRCNKNRIYKYLTTLESSQYSSNLEPTLSTWGPAAAHGVRSDR